MAKHCMGLTHTYGKDDESPEHGVSHEHGVSRDWIRKTLSTPNKNTGKFGPHSQSDVDRNKKKSAGLVTKSLNHTPAGRERSRLFKAGMNRATVASVLSDKINKSSATSAKKESGWDKWKAKKGKK